MNRKQWVLLIIMSTVLISSAMTMILLLLSEPESDYPENPQPEDEITITDEPDQQEAEEPVPKKADRENTDKNNNETTFDDGETVNEYFDETPGDESDFQEEVSDHPPEKDPSNDSQTDTDVQIPSDPIEPEVNFEVPN